MKPIFKAVCLLIYVVYTSSFFKSRAHWKLL